MHCANCDNVMHTAFVMLAQRPAGHALKYKTKCTRHCPAKTATGCKAGLHVPLCTTACYLQSMYSHQLLRLVDMQLTASGCNRSKAEAWKRCQQAANPYTSVANKYTCVAIGSRIRRSLPPQAQCNQVQPQRHHKHHCLKGNPQVLTLKQRQGYLLNAALSPPRSE